MKPLPFPPKRSDNHVFNLLIQRHSFAYYAKSYSLHETFFPFIVFSQFFCLSFCSFNALLHHFSANGWQHHTIKPHLHGRLFCSVIRRFFMRENLSRIVVTHTRQDSLAAIAFGKNRCRVSNTCDLRCRLYFCATRCNSRSLPWSLTRGRFQRLESHKAKSRSCKQQIVCNLRVAKA